MGLFSRTTAPSFASAPIQAAAGSSQVGNFLNYATNSDEIRALSVPAVSRSRDLIAGLIGSTGLKHYSKVWSGSEYEEVYLPLEPWMERPDPKVTRSFFMVNIFTDLFMRGVAYAYVTTRYSDGRPASFTWLPAANISSTDQPGYPQFYGVSKELQFNGQPLDVNNVIQFISPIEGILQIGARAINTALYLNQAADRLASLETSPGYLQQVSGEDMDGEFLGELASAWAAARKSNQIGALSTQIKFVEFQNFSETIGDQRKYQALEIARLCNIPGYLLGIDQSGMTYTNAQQARQDLFLFAARIYMTVIEQTLSADNVIPRGRYVEFDISDLGGLADDTASVMAEPSADERQQA